MVNVLKVIAIWLFTSVTLQGIECCNFFHYEDPRCYLEYVNGRYLVRANAAGTHMDIQHCRIVTGEIYSPHSHHTYECNGAQHGEIHYVSSASSSSSSAHSSSSSTSSNTGSGSSSSSSTSSNTGSGGGSSAGTPHSQHHYVCYSNHSYYRGIFDDANRAHCHTQYSVFEKLEYLRRTDHYCLSTLVREMAGLSTSSCDCSNNLHIHYSFYGAHRYHDGCMQNSIYKDTITRYLSNVPYSFGFEPTASCQTNDQFWQDLLRLRNSDTHTTNCFDEYVHLMAEAYMVHGEPPCSSCHVSTSHTNDGHTFSSNVGAWEYTAYMNGECLSEHTVWSFLLEQNSKHYHGHSRDQVIAEMAARYPYGSNDKCMCTKQFDLEYIRNFEDNHWIFSCSGFQGGLPYKNALSHLLNHATYPPTAQTCHSHEAIWQELDYIVKHNQFPEDCLQNLIHLLHEAVQKQGDPCICHSVSSSVASTTRTQTSQVTSKTTQTTTTATQPPTTQPSTTTTHPTTKTTTTTTVKPTTTTQPITTSMVYTTTFFTGHSSVCSKIHTIEELAKFQQLYPALNIDCSRNISSSDHIVRDLCTSIPQPINWKPGVKVTESCDILRNYIPVATFDSSSSYRTDGLSGVFLGCTNDYIKIATQECGGKFEILNLSRHPVNSESFTHSASNYYVIMY